MRHDESKLQQACVRWFRYQYPQYALLLFAVPNGGARSMREAAIMKAEGVTAGVADLILLAPGEKKTVLCIEMKTDKGRQSAAQKQWQLAAEKAGNAYAVVRSVDDFISTVNDYLTGQKYANE